MSYQEHLTAGLGTIWHCTASEAAERVAPKRKRISQDAVREEVPWTAARCNRLLRTITSRVNILRKQSKLCATNPSERDARTCHKPDYHAPKVTTPSRKDRRTSATDPEWIPGAKLGPISKTYGGNTRTLHKNVSRKADSGFSTPFVKRLLKHGPTSTAKPLFHDSVPVAHPRKMRQLPIQLASSNEEAQQNLVKAFDSLLTITSSKSDTERTGARSLMGACLRRVPGYIDIEAEDLDDDCDDKEDITPSIYNELESLGTNSEGGWSGLREVVRSHAMHHVCVAMDEGLIHDNRVSELISSCSKHGALREADALAQTWIGREQSGTPSKVGDSHLAFAKLIELRSAHDARELYLRQHTRLIETRCVDLGSVLRPGSILLKDMISGLVRGPGQDVALAYLEAAVVEDLDSNTASLPVLSRLAGLLSSLALAQATSTHSSAPVLDLSAAVDRIATTVLQHQSHTARVQDLRESMAVTSRAAIHPFTMAATLLSLASSSGAPTMVTGSFDTSVHAIASHQSDFVEYTCSVAHHIHRFSDADELEAIVLATSGMLAPPRECSDETRNILSRLAFEVALAYREQTGIDTDQYFADKLATNNNTSLTIGIAQTPRRRVQVSGYKWEEGLCEWVAATPLPKPVLAKAPPKDHGHSSPIQLLTPKPDKATKSPRPSLQVPQSSPDVIASLRSPTHTDNSTSPRARPVLQELSSNQQVHVPSPSPQKKQVLVKSTIVVPKQVHLKEERAKKAALLLAAQNAASKQVCSKKRSRVYSAANTSSAIEGDELGTMTPARKRAKRMSKSRRASVRTSLPARATNDGGMSEDELGL